MRSPLDPEASISAPRADGSSPGSNNPPPLPHQHHAPEQVTLDHQGVEPMHVGSGIDPAQEQDVLGGADRLVHGAAKIA